MGSEPHDTDMVAAQTHDRLAHHTQITLSYVDLLFLCDALSVAKSTAVIYHSRDCLYTIPDLCRRGNYIAGLLMSCDTRYPGY
jgi:hypothetical protein